MSFNVKSAKGPFDSCAFPDHIESLSRMKNWKSTGKLPFLDIMKMVNKVLHLCMEPNSFPNGDLQTLWSTAMTPVAFDDDFDRSRASHNRTFFTPYVTEFPYRPIVEAIDFINTLKASLLDQKFSSTDSLLCWLKEQPNFFVSWNVGLFLQKERNKAYKAGNMTIMTTHMGFPNIF